MMIYVMLNSMIWFVVFVSGGTIVPSNWHEKEVFNWGMSKKEVPKWLRRIQRKLGGDRVSRIIHRKDVVELVDTGSTSRDSSRHGSSVVNGDVPATIERPQSFNARREQHPNAR